jgi:excisionase family DNA binding protein
MAIYENKPASRLTDPPVPRRLMSQAEAAEYLGVSTRTIRAYIARGVLKANRIRGSRLIRIDAAELDALVRPVPTGWDVHE